MHDVQKMGALLAIRKSKEPGWKHLWEVFLYIYIYIYNLLYILCDSSVAVPTLLLYMPEIVITEHTII